MIVSFNRYDMPIAYSMIFAARRARQRTNGTTHYFEQYFYYWTAFNNIYTTIAFTGGKSPELRTNPDGTIRTRADGSVRIPDVKQVSEREQIKSALEELNETLKDALIVHPSTEFFARRTPLWNGFQIAFDAAGQPVNGVINVGYTVNASHPVWSPIDVQAFEKYLKVPDDHSRDLLARQIVFLLYTIRCNLVHGGKRADDANDVTVVAKALPLLEMIVNAFTHQQHSN